MKKSYNQRVNDVINKANIVLEVLDARFVKETRNIDLEQRIKNRNNILMVIINKCDYVDKKELEHYKKEFENCMFLSAKHHLGTTMLKRRIQILAAQNKIKDIVIGVVGYPNVGKSSIINALKGKGSARISPVAGFTRGEQLLRVGPDMMMIDTPGVIPRYLTDDSLVFVGAKNPEDLEEPDLTIIELMKKYPGMIEEHYGIKTYKDLEETLEVLAQKLNYKKKGNVLDINRVAIKILQDWVHGKIKK